MLIASKISCACYFEIFQVNIKIQLNTTQVSGLSFRFLWLCWKEIYLLPQKILLDYYVRSFQYKFLNNALYLNKSVLLFGKSSSSLCLHYKNDDETILHLFYECDITNALWKSVISSLIYLYICHSYHHRMLFLDSVVPAVMMFYLKSTFYFYSNFMYTIQENIKKFH